MIGETSSPAGATRPGTPQVVFIGGYGRSGSTLLERIVARVPGVVAIGELCFLWDRGIRDGQLCGCGRPLPECAFWSEVLERAFGHCWAARVEPMVEWQHAVYGLRNLPRLRHARLRGSRFSTALAEYRKTLSMLLHSIHVVTGGARIVDSSKDPIHAEMLAGLDDVELRLVHLVRDSRAVAHSWQRKRRRPEVHWQEEYMPRFSTMRSATAWSVKNALMARFGAGLERRSLVRYEDLVRSPGRELARIIEDLDLPAAPALIEQLAQGSVCLETDHTVAGNPVRFRTGELVLKQDNEWRSAMAPWRRGLVSAMTWPGLRSFGYREGMTG